MTTSSELSRLLLFCGYREVADFLSDSPINRHLYKQLLEFLPRHQIEVSMLNLFNEIYYQAVRVAYDATPGVDVGGRYLGDSEAQLQSQTATQLVYAVVWVLLRNKPMLAFDEECFLAQLTPFVRNSIFSDFAYRLEKEVIEQQIPVPGRFPTLTCPVDGLPRLFLRDEPDPDVPNLVKIFLQSDDYEVETHAWQAYSEAWIAVTGRFSQVAIERLVRLYKVPADQIRLVEMIQDACPREDLESHTLYFSELISRIRTGRFITEEPETKVDVNNSRELKVEIPAGSAPLSININIPTAQQVNVNPQNVINRGMEGE